MNRVQKWHKKSCTHIFFCLLPQRARECVCTFRREFLRASGQLGDLCADRRLQLSDSSSASDRLAVCSLPALIWPERLHSYSNPPAPAADVTGHCPSNVSDECTSLDYLTLVLGTLAFTALDFCRVPLATAASTGFRFWCIVALTCCDTSSYVITKPKFTVIWSLITSSKGMPPFWNVSVGRVFKCNCFRNVQM